MNTSSSLASHVPLPILDDELLRRSSGTGMIWGDSRRFGRTSANAQCLLRIIPTCPHAEERSGSQDVWLRNLGRGGAGFIHGAQLFPGDQCELTLPSDARLNLKVAWCRRLAAGVFVSGCQFVAHADGEPEQ